MWVQAFLAGAAICTGGSLVQTAAPNTAQREHVPIAAGLMKVVATELDGTVAESAPASDIGNLSTEATSQLSRVIRKRRIAESTFITSLAIFNRSRLTLSGEVRMPVSLPPSLIGFRAVTRRGSFAVATVGIYDAQGRMLDRESVKLGWGDGRWLVGGRVRRNQKLDRVLADYARKGADRAARRLFERLLDSRSHDVAAHD